MAEAFDHSLCAELGEEVESVERITNFTYVVECALPTICDPIDDCNLGGIFDAIGVSGVGPTGPQGAQGPMGDGTGPQGPQGTAGSNGSNGAQGVQGPQGAQGPQGHQGTQGVQGVQGVQGAQGSFGGNSRPFTFDTTTTDSDPGAGNLRLNNATLSSVTQAFVDVLDSGGAAVTAWLDALDDYGSTANRGTVHIYKLTDISVYAVYTLTAVTTATGYRKLTLTYLSSSGSFSNSDAIVLSFVYAGPTGSQGVQGPQGVQGAVGAQGVQGAAGPQGVQGTQGTQGTQGVQGPQGTAGSGGSGGFAIGTLAATMQRGDTGKAFTVTSGDTAATTVGDYTTQLPGEITLPTGMKLSAHQVGSDWSIQPPAYVYVLSGSGGSCASSAAVSFTTIYGAVTAHNRSASMKLSGWGTVAWDENASQWYFVAFNPGC